MAESFSEKSDSSEEESMNILLSIDLVAAARRIVSFLRRVSNSHWFNDPTSLVKSIRRYDELWMPLISELSSVGTMSTQMVLPPLDVQWVWFYHTLNPASYRLYCESRFSKLIEKAAIFDDENEEYALNRCRDIWSCKYPSEPFDLDEEEEEEPTSSEESIITDKSIMEEVSKHKSLYSKFYKPYMSEIVYLIAARKRYQGFLYMLQKFRDGYSKLIPTLDIQLMWLTHQSHPVVYAGDVKEMEWDLGKVVGIWEKVEDDDVKESKKLWERTFDQPYEKAGATFDEIVLRSIKCPVYWEVWNSDVNTKYKSLEPRFLLEVCVSMRAERETKEMQETGLRLRTLRCHRELKIDKPSISVPSDAWRKMWHLYCEFGTRGVTLELRRRSGGSRTTCCKKQGNSSQRSKIVFPWNELLRAPSLTLERDLELQWMRAVASITPPTQAPYLLKCLSDRVTDDSGTMVSDVILKMNRYRPQEGRWLTHTVLDHAGRECFVLRMRMGSGFWRRGGEAPVAVKKEERIIEVREGSWTYVAGSIGRAPGKFAGARASYATGGSAQYGECLAVYEGILWAKEQNISKLSIYSDCLPIVNFLSSNGSVRTNVEWQCMAILLDCLYLLTNFVSWNCKHVHRKNNQAADIVARYARHHKTNYLWRHHPPPFLSNVLCKDAPNVNQVI